MPTEAMAQQATPTPSPPRMPTAAFRRRARKMALPNAAKNIINTIAMVAITEGIAALRYVRNQEWRSTYPMAINGRQPSKPEIVIASGAKQSTGARWIAPQRSQ